MVDSSSSLFRSLSNDSAPAAERDARLVALVAALATGDRSALAPLYDATQRIVLALALRLTPEPELAEEVLLDTYLQAWRTAPSFDARRGQVLNWLLAIARSRAIDRRRSTATRAKREEAWSAELDDSLSDCRCGCEPSEAQAREERRDGVRAAIAALPEGQRRAVELAYLRGLTHTEIAERTGEPLGTVKTRIRLGLIKLKDALKSLEDVR